ncbi:MAG: SAF domain-containing protein [Nocardioides sp.]
MGQWTAAVLFVVVMALAAAWLYQRKGDMVEVLVVQRSVAAGAVIGNSDLGTAQVSGVAGALDLNDVESVVGMRAVAGLVPGQVLTDAAVTSDQLPAVGQKVVALRLDFGRVPDGLGAGAMVDVLAVPGEGETDPGALDDPTVLAAQVQVVAVTEAVDGGLVVSVLAPDASSDRVAAYAAAGRVTIIQAPTGQ